MEEKALFTHLSPLCLPHYPPSLPALSTILSPPPSLSFIQSSHSYHLFTFIVHQSFWGRAVLCVKRAGHVATDFIRGRMRHICRCYRCICLSSGLRRQLAGKWNVRRRESRWGWRGEEGGEEGSEQETRDTVTQWRSELPQQKTDFNVHHFSNLSHLIRSPRI